MESRHSGPGQLRPQTPTRRKVQSKEMAPKRRGCNKTTTMKLSECPRHHTPSNETTTTSKTRKGIESHQTSPHRVRVDTGRHGPTKIRIGWPVRVRKTAPDKPTNLERIRKRSRSTQSRHAPTQCRTSTTGLGITSASHQTKNTPKTPKAPPTGRHDRTKKTTKTHIKTQDKKTLAHLAT
jgi:hypothetical protein